MNGNKINYWKWAFIGLLGMLVFGGCYVGSKALTPPKQVAEVKKIATPNPSKYSKVNVSMDKNQMNATINYYLRKKITDKSMKYRFLVTDKVILMGTTKILGQNVSFTLVNTPKITSDGNIELNVDTVSIGTLKVPKKYILSYIKKNYDLGEFANINPNKKKIKLILNSFSNKQGIIIKAHKLDLRNDDLEVNVYVPLK